MSQHTKRYDLKSDGCGGQEMSERESGDWVMAADFDRAVSQRDELLAVLKELQESAGYWSEYDVPIGIVERINAAIAKAEKVDGGA